MTGLRDEEEGIVKCSNKRWQEISGSKNSNKMIVKWKKADPAIRRIESGIPTPCCYSTEQFISYLIYMLHYGHRLLEFYRQRRFRNLRRKTKIKRKKAYDILCNEISGGRPPDSVVIFYGGGRFSHASPGRPPTPNKHLFQELKRRFPKTRLACERGSSQICSTDGERLKSTKHYSLMQCTELCMTLWSRDVNASRCIRDKNLFFNLTGELSYFPQAHGNYLTQAEIEAVHHQ